MKCLKLKKSIFLVVSLLLILPNVSFADTTNIWAWGYNYHGQLGDGTTTIRYTPVQVSGLTGVTAIAGGSSHTIALKNDGTVWTWGSGGYGQLGDGTETDKSTPIQVSGLSEVTAIAAGSEHSIALKNDGTVWTWGVNWEGQLGDGTTTNRTTPIQVSGLTGITAIAGGYYHTIALKNDGTVWAWGGNYFGGLGDGTTTNRASPVQVSGLTGITAVAGGQHHTIALKNDGTVWALGNNGYGQLGDGTTTDRTTPVQVSGLTGITTVAGANENTIALKDDGTVWAWGGNWNGQLGDGTTTNRTTPIQVSGLTGITAVAGGNSHTIALKNDGTVWALGDNGSGQLGDGTTTNRATPVQVIGLTGVTAVACGSIHTIAIVTLDSTPPTGTISINSGAAYTNSTSVNLTLSCSDTSGCSEMQFSNDNTNWSTAETYTTSKVWTLTSGDGTKTVYVKFKDAAGNWTSAYSDTMILDTIQPSVTINIVTTPTNTTSQTVTGTVEAGATLNVTTDTAASDGSANVIGTTWSYTITGFVAGINNITVTATDAAGNTATATSAITLDTTSPAFSSTSPASNSSINTSTVGYTLSKDVASGSVTFTRTGGSADSSSHVYTFTVSDITAGTHSVNTGLILVNGTIYTVTFEATDSLENTGSVSNTNISYDTSAASVTITSPASNSVTNNAQVSYTLSEDISAGNIVFIRTGGTADGISPHTYALNASEMTAGSHTVDTGLSMIDGAVYTVGFESITDMAGNPSSNISNTNITYDSTAVAITSTTPAASSIITSSTVNYTLSEQASSGSITFTWTGGTADSGSPHVYNLTASDLTSGSHTINTNLTLVDGAFYTISFDATDLVGNAATTVSNAMVYYDSAYDPESAAEGNVDNTGASASRVDGFDLIKLSLAFGSRPGDANWNPACDLDGNGVIEGNDLIVLGSHFGEVQ